MRAIDDPVAYNRALYAKSPRERLRRINHSRRQRGSAEIASLADSKLVIPLSEDERAVGISGFDDSGAPY
jgi:hypothetical protein